MNHAKHGRHQLELCGQQQAQRDRQSHDPNEHPLAHRHVRNELITRCAAVWTHVQCPGREAEAAPLAVERDQLVVAAIATAQVQRCRWPRAEGRGPRAEMLHRRKVSNSSLGGLRQVGPGSVFGSTVIEEDRFLVVITRLQGLGCFKFASVFVRAAARGGEALSIYKHNCGIGVMALLPAAQT